VPWPEAKRIVRYLTETLAPVSGQQLA